MQRVPRIRAPHRAEIRADRLTPEQRQHVWRRIQAEQPALAELLRSPFVASLREQFGAVPAFDRRWLEPAPAGQA